MISTIMTNSKHLCEGLYSISKHLESEVMQPLTLAHSGKLESIGQYTKGDAHSVGIDNAKIEKFNIKWILHTHLHSNDCPSMDDIIMLFQFNHNNKTDITHIIVDSKYIWVYNSQKVFYGNINEKIKDISKKYLKYKNTYSNNLEQLTEKCKIIGINLYRFANDSQDELMTV